MYLLDRSIQINSGLNDICIVTQIRQVVCLKLTRFWLGGGVRIISHPPPALREKRKKRKRNKTKISRNKI